MYEIVDVVFEGGDRKARCRNEELDGHGSIFFVAAVDERIHVGHARNDFGRVRRFDGGAEVGVSLRLFRLP